MVRHNRALISLQYSITCWSRRTSKLGFARRSRTWPSASLDGPSSPKIGATPAKPTRHARRVPGRPNRIPCQDQTPLRHDSVSAWNPESRPRCHDTLNTFFRLSWFLTAVRRESATVESPPPDHQRVVRMNSPWNCCILVFLFLVFFSNGTRQPFRNSGRA